MIAVGTSRAFSPTAFMEQVIEAVLPLIGESGTELREGATDTDVVLALQPLFGHFTVFDAVMVHFMLDPAGNTDSETADGRDNPRSHAIFTAREALIHFACNARASSARCAEARAYLAEHEGDMDQAPHGSVLSTIGSDVKYVSRGRYRGQRFGDIDGCDGWLPGSMLSPQREAANDGDAA